MRLPSGRTRAAAVGLLAVAAVVGTGSLVASGAALARTPVTRTFAQLPAGPWLVDQPATVDGEVLTLGPYGSVGLHESQPNDWIGGADNDLGWVVEARMRLDGSVTADCLDAPARIWAADHLTGIHLAFGPGQVCLAYPDVVRVAMDTQSAFHTYRLHVRRERVRLWVDGRLAVDHILSWAGGGTPALVAESLDGTSHWRYLRYDVTPSLPRCTIVGTPGPDRLVGGPGADVICGGGGDDEVIGGGGDDVLIGGLGDDVLVGGRGHDTLLGGHGDDLLDGGPQNDALHGGQGNDRFPALGVRDGGDLISGGAGTDTADYRARPAVAPVTVTLDGRPNDGTAGENDRVGLHRWDNDTRYGGSDVESVLGGAGPDTLTGDHLANRLDGGAGVDVLSGLDGPDTLLGVDGAPADTLDGGNGVDACTGDTGDVLASCNDKPCPSSSTGMTMPPWSPSPSAPHTPSAPGPSAPGPSGPGPSEPRPSATPTPPAPHPSPSTPMPSSSC
jgi:Ca2+-binding RTX toxin-like protein